ncbi:hypothetical protein PMAC_000696 [Pneumocystis sp. 'macacae']|nr:hypothetical protein PMAC_000696 [Pneumocystis sp. 'macacae']
MIQLDKKIQNILLDWTTDKLSFYKNSTETTISKENKYSEKDYEISQNIRNVLIYSKPDELVVCLKGGEKSVLLYYFLYIFINIKYSSLPHHIQISLFQTLSTWFSRCIQAIERFPSIKDELLDIFTDSVWKKMYDFIWERWEINNTMQNILRELFTKIVSLQKSILSYNHLKKLLNDVLYKALNENTSIKASTYVIDILAKFLGINSILTIEPDFFAIRVLFLKDIALAPSLSRMLINFLIILRHDLNRDFQKNSNEIWVEYWLPYIIECFCKKDHILEQNITKWLLPGILGQSIEYYKIVINKLKDNKQLNSDQYLSLLIAILKIGNDSNVFQEFNDQNLKTLGLLENTITNLLNSLSMSHRLSVLSLIVKNSKLSTPISFNHLNLIMTNLPKLIIDSDASSRNSILDIINKIFLRLSSCSYTFSKNLKKINQIKACNDSKSSDILTNIENFIFWLYDFVKREMLPGLSYTRVVTALNIVRNLIDTGIDPNISLHFEKKIKMNFHFSLKIFDATMVRILTDQFLNPYEEPQRLATELLCMSPFPIDGLSQQEELTMFFNRSLELTKSNRAINAKGGAKALYFIFEKIIVKHHGVIKTENLVSNINVLDNPIKMVQALIDELDNSIYIGSKDLLLGANSFPLHGILLTLQYILDSIHSNMELYIETRNYWVSVSGKLINSCQNIWKIVSPILSNDSYQILLSEDIININISENDKNNKYLKINNSKQDSSTQIILTYSWRAIKEVSALLAIILSHQLNETSQFLETIYQQHIHGGKLFKEWFIDIRHSGAISTIYPNFITICSALFASPEKKLNSFPETWLQEIIFFLKKKTFITKSDGLSYCITGILTSEIDNTRPLLLKTVEELMIIAEFDNRKNHINIPQIHAFNTLRIIFLEARLSNISTKFIERGFILSINGLKSNIWTVRNSSMMLFNALLIRALGNRKYKQDNCPNIKTMSIRTFFSRYPKLKEYLLQQLKDYISQFDKYNTDILYIGLNSILTLISYFEVAVDYSDNRWTGMDEFMPLLDHCSRSHIWRVREVSAKAMPTILSPSIRITVIIDTINCCTVNIQNTLHGNLLKVKYLIQSWTSHLNSKNICYIKELKAFYTNVTNVLIKKFDTIIRNNPCAITKNLALEIIFTYFIKHNWIKENINTKFEELAFKEETTKLCCMTIKFCIDFFESKKYDQKIFGQDLFLKQASTVLLYGTLISSIIIYKVFTIISKGKSVTLKKKAALSLFNILNISSFSSLNMYDLKVMASEAVILLEDPYNIYLKDGILLLVSLWYIESNEVYWKQFSVWVKYLDLNSNDDKDFIKRMSVIQSLICFSGHLVLNNTFNYFSQQLEHILPLYFILLKLLKDDDQKIRDFASEAVSRIISEKTIFSSVYSSELLLNNLSIVYKSSFLFKEKLLNLLIDFEDITEFQNRLLSCTQKTNKLFIHEKTNLWKDNIRDNYEAIKTLTLLNDNDEYIVNKLTLWANSFSKILLKIINEKGYDGHLGWTSNENVIGF